MSENEIESLESKIPELSAAAVKQAYTKALESGLSVYVSGPAETGPGSAVFEVFPDGRRRTIKRTESPMQMPAGTTVRIP